MAGLFITFEGGEGAGKTSQINRLAQSLTEAGHKVVTTREPGGTPESERIRDLLVQRDGGNWTPMAETLLFFAARVMLVEKTILPAIKDGSIVICDRFTDSTRAYQGYGHDFDLDVIESLKETTLGGLEPDLTFILDIDPTVGLERSERRLAAEALAIKQKEDRFEAMDMTFHERLRQGFLSIAKNNPQRCHVIDAAQDLETVAQDILKTTLTRLG
ncbi:MAG: dTMP kinase [Alphaproteobacteria bacterium]